MRQSRLALLLQLLFTFLIAAAPQNWVLVEKSPAGLGPWKPCDFTDEDCQCAERPDKRLEVFCGLVDPSWITVYRGRRLDESAGLTEPEDLTNDPADFDINDATVILYGDDKPPAETSKLVRRAELIKRDKRPLIAALATIGFAQAYTGVTHVIRNRFPRNVENRWVNGIKGKLPKAQVINGVKFLAGAVFEIRWDYAAKGSTSGIEGPHVNMQVQDDVNRQTFAWYFPKESFFYAKDLVASLGNMYFDQVVQRLTDVAEYDSKTGTWDRDETWSATRVATKWYNDLMKYEKDELKRV
ncbi:MAG: hypothetical protein M1833_000963 [Piccolia ochrophora]|nr:MAG: hypothetical protein M1833_000963 [Piccolia ochrophora]